MEKGIAITTILALLVGIVVVGIIVFLAYSYVPSPVLSEQDCRARLISWCTSCSVAGWKDVNSMNDELKDCVETYFYTGTLTGEIKCDSNIGTQSAKVFCSAFLGNRSA
jgi:hypothetical protein